LGYNNTPSHQEVLRTVIKTNKHKDCQALATYSLGLLFKKNVEEAKGDDKNSHILAAEEHFNIVREKYANVKLGEESLGELAASQLFGLKMMNQLQVGKPVPEISGEDLDGKALKLSDFKGKVTMLSFWATWCQPCMALVPHEIALAESMKNRPFDLVGVNGDELDDAVRDRIADKRITWRSFKNAQSGQAPLSDIWGIHGWPTIFVIDSEGIIRHIWKDSPGEKVLAEAIEELVKEAERKGLSK
jgi:thiol-disulfide isomerase/thioredoxin